MFSPEIKERKKTLILNSRQPLDTSGSCLWLKNTIEAIRWVTREGHILVTSVGMQTWEVVLFLAVKNCIPRIVLIPCSGKESFSSLCSFYSRQFNLDDGITEYLPVETGNEAVRIESVRDQCAVGVADILVPVALRKNGTLMQLLSTVEKSTLQSQFVTQYQARSAPLNFRYNNGLQVNDQLIDVSAGYLFHWTRTTYEPWPDERMWDYYDAIISSNSYARTALKTLEHILDSGAIIGSSRHMPGGQRCVSFTGKRPDEFLPLMRWRSRYHEMSYEPYGIGVRKSAALADGVIKVFYTDSRNGKENGERWLLQSSGKKGNWVIEDEYRCKDDFRHSGVEKKDLLVVCATPDEAPRLFDTFGIRVLPMFKKCC